MMFEERRTVVGLQGTSFQWEAQTHVRTLDIPGKSGEVGFPGLSRKLILIWDLTHSGSLRG